MAKTTGKITVKATFGDDLRRFTIPDAVEYQSLKDVLRNRFNLDGDFKLKWKDEDGDLITFSSDEELREAMDQARAASGGKGFSYAGNPSPGILRLTLVPDTSSSGNKKRSVDGLDEQKLTKLVEEACTTLEIPIQEATKFINSVDLSKLQQLRDRFGPFQQWLQYQPLIGAWLKNFFTTGDTSGCPFFSMPRNEGEREAVHRGVECDECGAAPIRGTRFKSLTRHNFDLCGKCKESGKHDDQQFEELKQPQRHPWGAPWGRRGPWGGCPVRRGGPWWGRPHDGGANPAAGRGPWAGKCRGAGGSLSSRFVRDVTVWDGTQMAPASKFVKIWKLRNDGTDAWPEATALIHVGGDALGSTHPAVIGALAPGAEVDVSVDCAAPSNPGRYVGFWRLSANGKDCGFRRGGRFGQRIWAQIVVVPEGATAEVESEVAPVGDGDAEAAEVAKESRSTGEKAVDAAAGAAATAAAAAEGAAAGASATAEQVEGFLSNVASKLQEGLKNAEDGVAGGGMEENIGAFLSDLGGKLQSGGNEAADSLAGMLGGIFTALQQATPVPKADAEEEMIAAAKEASLREAAAAAVAEEPLLVAEAPREPAAPVEDEEPPSPSPLGGEEPVDVLHPMRAVMEQGAVEQEEHVELPPGTPLPPGTVLPPGAVEAELARRAAAENVEEEHVVLPPGTPLPAGAVEALRAAVEASGPPSATVQEIMDMGFSDRALVEQILKDNGGAVERAVQVLVQLQEWDPMLAELEEMGFDNADVNKRVLLESGGSIDRTILKLCKMRKEN